MLKPKTSRGPLRLLLACALAWMSGSAGLAQEMGVRPVLVSSWELSACAATDANEVLLADDELIGSVLLCPLSFQGCRILKLERDYKEADGKKAEKLMAIQDFEGLSMDGSTAYLLGSHQGKSGKQRPDREFLLRATYKVTEDKGEKKLELKVTDKNDDRRDLFRLLAKSLPYDPQDLGSINLEGLAVCGGTVYIGARSPLAKDNSAIVLSASVQDVFSKDGPKELKLQELPLDGAGVRALECLDGARLWVMSGPAQDPAGVPFQARVCDLSANPVQCDSPIQNVPFAQGRAEGLCKVGAGLLAGFDAESASTSGAVWFQPK